MTEQSLAQNIDKNIDTTTFIIYWKMRNWKTLLGILQALKFYPRIYSNFQIYDKGKSIVNFIDDFRKIEKIRFSYTPWVLVIDEAWLNANSKDTRGQENRLLQEVLFLIGKKNLSLIWIAQRYESIDVNARVLADYVFQCKKINRWDKTPLFRVKKQIQRWTKLETLHEYYLDSIGIMKMLNISYNQLEESRIKKIKHLENEEKENNLI